MSTLKETEALLVFIWCHVCHMFVIFFVSQSLKLVSKQSANVLPSIPKRQKAVMCLAEKIHVLNKFCPVIYYSAVDCDFHVNKSTVYTQ